MLEYLESVIENPRVWETIRDLPRDRFVIAEYLDLAFEDRPLPIGYGQTISQPLVVALMTQLLEPEPTDRVLEIGTGSGYQTAILAKLVETVYTIEYIKPLAERARDTLQSLGFENVHYQIGDGFNGWREYAPYQGIILAAAAKEVPAPLLEQLADGGRLIIPLGEPGEIQTLWKYKRQGREILKEEHGLVRFVPLVRGNS